MMSKTADKKISVIIVNYKSKKKIEHCLKSVFDSMGKIDSEIIIVNNDAQSFSKEISDKFLSVKIIEKNENIGFGKGINLGANVARGEYLLILNPDTEILSKNVQSVLDEFDKNEEIGIIGSRIVGFEGKTQTWIAGTEKNLWDLIGNNFGVCSSQRIWANPVKIKADWVAATAMFIKKELFFKLAGFDEKFFMYFEDTDLCRRVRSLGEEVFYYPDFTVKHWGGTSFNSQKEQKKHYYDAQEYYFKKHRPKWEYLFIRLLRIFYS